jgi:hypothetical protein
MSDSQPDHPRIHATGLATDFLNRYHEPVMLLDLVPGEPACLSQFLDWTPCTYVEHFARSRFSGRQRILEAYFEAPAGSREALAAVVTEMSKIIVATQVELKREPEPAAQAEIAAEAADRLRDLLIAAGAIIHGRRRAEIADAQAGIDRLFDRRMDS